MIDKQDLIRHLEDEGKQEAARQVAQKFGVNPAA